MTQNLFKNVSAAQLEAAIAKALGELVELTGDQVVEVSISGLDFKVSPAYADTKVAFTVQAHVSWPGAEGGLF